MPAPSRFLSLLFVCHALAVSAADNDSPRSLDPRLKIELFAEHPTIVTPTGIDVDHLGRVWAIESNTHFPPPGYNRHPTDRLYVMSDKNGDGRAAGDDEVVTFADGFTAAMSVAVRLGDDGQQDVFVATRMAIFRLRDNDGDGRADLRDKVVWLDTAGNYPHNGLGGFAFDALGWMYFGFGENLGAKYVLNGSDRGKLAGSDGGNVYRCRPDGSKLSLWATGFWNPHASCVDAFGRLFTVDNDPDSRPPCRLLHTVEGGDYGYKFRNGRKGLHPFSAWNGEILGTLPMVAGTGEAPSGIVAYESDGFPSDYLGDLLVGSWGDHRIDRFRLKPKGCSFTSQAEAIVTGGEDFRPVGLAVAPDGSLYCTDWVKKEYKLHSHGRVWRISAVQRGTDIPVLVSTISRLTSVSQLQDLLKSPRLEVRRAAAKRLALFAPGQLEETLNSATIRRRSDAPQPAKHPASKRARIESLWAMWNSQPKPVEHPLGLLGPTPKSVALAVSGPFDEVSTAARRLIGFRLSPFDARPRPEFHLDAFRMLEVSRAMSKPGVKLELSHQPVEDAGLLLAAMNQYSLGDAHAAALLLDVEEPFLFNLAVQRCAADTPKSHSNSPGEFLNPRYSPRVRTGLLLAARQRTPSDATLVRAALADPSIEVRRAAVQWAAEESLKDLRPQVEAVLDAGPVTPDLFLTTIAGLQMLDGVSPQDIDQTPAAEFAIRIAKEEKRPAAVRAIALRLVTPGTKGLDGKLLENLLSSTDPQLRLEAIRTLRSGSFPEAANLLRNIAENAKEPSRFRAEAILGLSTTDATEGPANQKTLLGLLGDSDLTIRREAVLALRAPQLDDATRAALNGLLQTNGARSFAGDIHFVLQGKSTLNSAPATGGDPAAGERVFFHPRAAGCFKCHTVHGRGGRIGPDLTVIAATMSREKLAQSILEPSREISPQFTNWLFELKDGRVHTGMILSEIEGRIELGNAEGNIVRFHLRDVEQSTPQKTSVMPEKLAEQLSPDQFRDLLTYLETLK